MTSPSISISSASLFSLISRSACSQTTKLIIQVGESSSSDSDADTDDSDSEAEEDDSQSAGSASNDERPELGNGHAADTGGTAWDGNGGAARPGAGLSSQVPYCLSSLPDMVMSMRAFTIPHQVRVHSAWSDKPVRKITLRRRSQHEHGVVAAGVSAKHLVGMTLKSGGEQTYPDHLSSARSSPDSAGDAALTAPRSSRMSSVSDAGNRAGVVRTADGGAAAAAAAGASAASSMGTLPNAADLARRRQELELLKRLIAEKEAAKLLKAQAQAQRMIQPVEVQSAAVDDEDNDDEDNDNDEEDEEAIEPDHGGGAVDMDTDQHDRGDVKPVVSLQPTSSSVAAAAADLQSLSPQLTGRHTDSYISPRSLSPQLAASAIEAGAAGYHGVQSSITDSGAGTSIKRLRQAELSDTGDVADPSRNGDHGHAASSSVKRVKLEPSTEGSQVDYASSMTALQEEQRLRDKLRSSVQRKRQRGEPNEPAASDRTATAPALSTNQPAMIPVTAGAAAAPASDVIDRTGKRVKLPPPSASAPHSAAPALAPLTRAPVPAGNIRLMHRCPCCCALMLAGPAAVNTNFVAIARLNAGLQRLEKSLSIKSSQRLKLEVVLI